MLHIFKISKTLSRTPSTTVTFTHRIRYHLQSYCPTWDHYQISHYLQVCYMHTTCQALGLVLGNQNTQAYVLFSRSSHLLDKKFKCIIVGNIKEQWLQWCGTFFSHACPCMCARTFAQKAEIGMIPMICMKITLFIKHYVNVCIKDKIKK